VDTYKSIYMGIFGDSCTDGCGSGHGYLNESQPTWTGPSMPIFTGTRKGHIYVFHGHTDVKMENFMSLSISMNKDVNRNKLRTTVYHYWDIDMKRACQSSCTSTWL
jgi:hypothetical protein